MKVYTLPIVNWLGSVILQSRELEIVNCNSLYDLPLGKCVPIDLVETYPPRLYSLHLPVVEDDTYLGFIREPACTVRSRRREYKKATDREIDEFLASGRPLAENLAFEVWKRTE